MGYFNFRLHEAFTAWERWEFVANWRRLYAGDSRWAPPFYPTLRRELNPQRNTHLARMQPRLLYLEGMKASGRSQSDLGLAAQPMPVSGLWERTLAATAVTIDPRRSDHTAHLSLLHCINDQESLRYFLGSVAERLRQAGCYRLLGPTGLSPHLGNGALLDQWHQTPPLHTAYNPPYFPELLESVMKPVQRYVLYRLPTPDDVEMAVQPATLLPLEPARLATDLLPLLRAAVANPLSFPLPDAEEAAFLLRWIGNWSTNGWLAAVDDTPVGFVLLQPDLAARLRRAGGGRNWLWRLWFAWARKRPLRCGRLLFGAVLPEYHRRGIGRQLLRQAMATARQAGWESLTVGPLPEGDTAVALLKQFHAQPQQTYQLYEWLF